MATTLLPLLLGFLTGLSLIVAIGAQNAFVLRLGIQGQVRLIAPVVAICAASDAVLITVGILGIGAILAAAPAALVVIRILGSGFLIVYGLLAARRAMKPAALTAAAKAPTQRLGIAVTTAIAFTWLNPHVYLDTVLFLGSVANQQGVHERWWWAAGAIIASCVWFSALGFGARLLRPIFERPSAWRVLDSIIAAVMIALGLRLAIWG